MPCKKRRCAIVTMAKNESVFLPVWWHYYSQFFQPEDIYILDHETTDGSTSGGGFVRVPVSHPKVDWGWHRDMLQEQQHKLIEKYDMVLCTDVDEIVAPDPRTGTLGDYINRFEHDFVNCRGYETFASQGNRRAAQFIITNFTAALPLVLQSFLFKAFTGKGSHVLAWGLACKNRWPNPQ